MSVLKRWIEKHCVWWIKTMFKNKKCCHKNCKSKTIVRLDKSWYCQKHFEERMSQIGKVLNAIRQT
jgi:hypothetical protein